eukprot:CAMPEP_0201515108 /NCGR_PEP_ID=MMETSP0161_2-20130828/6763_1 /ASSEMBLY_ACC=CAM_ASM_000251 /TAXON_ID=180227 /ORGANISM="Neoparamoeba aestuarina, Strain SoJaBio B1-5/56/2" /LENGTH=243 /DNA_ID=CAMNT_0047911837 /DNA_START=191 /DNA_END=925 /DNA_ORIENTATION=+
MNDAVSSIEKGVSQASRKQKKDPVNGYRYFFLRPQANGVIHTINEETFFHGIDDCETDNDHGTTDEPEFLQAVEPSSKAREDAGFVESPSADVEEVNTSTAIVDPTLQTLGSAQQISSSEAIEFDKILKDMTRESFSAIRQQNTLKAMSGRRVHTNQSQHLVNLRKARETESPYCQEKRVDADMGTIPVTMAIRNKTKISIDTSRQGNSKGKAPSKIDFRVLRIPKDESFMMQHHVNVQSHIS